MEGREINKCILKEVCLNENVSITVVRDDFIEGGTKIRGLLSFFKEKSASEFVYPSPAFGAAQIAIAYACKYLNKKAVIFVAKRKFLHENTLKAQENGAKIVQVEHGRLIVIKKRASDYVCESKETRCLLPWGLAGEF